MARHAVARYVVNIKPDVTVWHGSSACIAILAKDQAPTASEVMVQDPDSTEVQKQIRTREMCQGLTILNLEVWVLNWQALLISEVGGKDLRATQQYPGGLGLAVAPAMF